MAEIIPWTIYESKRIEFDNCTSAGPLFGIGVFTSTATNRLAPTRATAQEVQQQAEINENKSKLICARGYNFTYKYSNTYFIA